MIFPAAARGPVVLQSLLPPALRLRCVRLVHLNTSHDISPGGFGRTQLSHELKNAADIRAVPPAVFALPAECGPALIRPNRFSTAATIDKIHQYNARVPNPIDIFAFRDVCLNCMHTTAC